MKNKFESMCYTVLVGSVLTTSFALATAEPKKEDVLWMNCCQRQEVGMRCSDAKSRNACYYTCQVGCGYADSINGKKCRQFCDIRWA